MDTIFGHNSEPKAVKLVSKPIFREDDTLPNIMFDPRVMRGSTYSQHNRDQLVVGTDANPIASGSGVNAGRRLKAPGMESSGASKKKLRWREKSIYDYRAPLGRGADLDLSAHLVEKEVTVSTAEADTQADDFEPAPEEPPFRPRKTGVDASTHMDQNNQPFDFNRDVQPLLSVVVGKTLEQSLLEVEQEAELDAIAKHLADLNEEKEADAQRVAELEAQTHKGWQAKESRRACERARCAREKAVREKVASVRLLKQNWPVVLEQTTQHLESLGVWVNPVVWQVRGDFLPWMYEGIAKELDGREAAGRVIDSLMADAMLAQERANDRSGGAGRAQKATSWVRVFLEAKSLGLEEDTVVGPIKVEANDTIADLERKIQHWLVEQGLSVKLPPEGLLHLAAGGRELQGANRIIDERIADEKGEATLEVLLPPLNTVD